MINNSGFARAINNRAVHNSQATKNSKHVAHATKRVYVQLLNRATIRENYTFCIYYISVGHIHILDLNSASIPNSEISESDLYIDVDISQPARFRITRDGTRSIKG